MTDLVLYDTHAREKRTFVPQDPARVTMYVCGPTVYGPAHIGNMRPPVVFDVLFRVLRARYGDDHVVYARNFTDVDDKINAAAAEQGVEIGVITERFTQVYLEDTRALGVLTPTLQPSATGHMGEMIALVQTLIDSGAAYEAEGHVLFSVAAYADYGKFANRSLDEMIAGARVEVAPYKKDPADFVLWKPSAADEPGWDSPWGRGRPGWHLECSAMIAANLGETIDIHGGGVDLVFPHHQNEIAQSACAHGGAPLANYWLHNGFLSIDKEKMSKSIGNVVRPHDLLADGTPGEAIRYALLTAQYRAPLDWSDALLERAQKSLDRLYGVLRRLKDVTPADAAPPDAVVDALNDDLNTPRALAALFEIAGRANKAETLDAQSRAKGELLASGALLGLLEADPEAWFGIAALDDAFKAEIDALLQERAKARQVKDFEAADAARDAVAAKGVLVEDGPEGTTWRLARS